MNPEEIVFLNAEQAGLLLACLDNAKAMGNYGLRSIRFHRESNGQIKWKVNEGGWTAGYGCKETERTL